LGAITQFSSQQQAACDVIFISILNSKRAGCDVIFIFRAVNSVSRSQQSEHSTSQAVIFISKSQQRKLFLFSNLNRAIFILI
jgi:hypothetical protein